MTAAAALFEQPSPGTYAATGHSRGPWDDRHCHGGPVAALLARAVEQFDDGHPSGYWQISRLTIELTRPVPVGDELVIATEPERPGRQVSLVGLRLRHGDVEVAVARALRIRRADIDLGAVVAADDEPPPQPDGVEDERWEHRIDDTVRFHSHGCRHRVVSGAYGRPGATTAWIALSVPVVADEEPSGVQRVAAAVDFGNGISNGVPSDEVTFINPDLTIHLAREPVGEWIAIASSTHYGLPANVGTALAESAVHDARGRVGRSVQSVILLRR